MKKILLGIIILAGATLAACSGGGGGGERYPQYYENQWVTACIDAAGSTEASDFCHCTLNEVEAHVSFADYTALEEDMANDPNYTPQVITDAILACLDKVPADYTAPEDSPEF